METIPQRFPIEVGPKIGEVMVDSRATKTRWALVARIFSMVYRRGLEGKTEYTGYLSTPSVDPSGCY